MRVDQIANLVRSHTGDPMRWIKTIYGTMGYMEIQDMQDGINMCSNADRQQTANNLQVSLNNHQLQMAAYKQVYGHSADEYQMDSAETSRQFLITLIEMLRG